MSEKAIVATSFVVGVSIAWVLVIARPEPPWWVVEMIFTAFAFMIVGLFVGVIVWAILTGITGIRRDIENAHDG